MPRNFCDYIASQELPEECPVCGYPNADDEGEPIFKDDPSFCSARCRDQYSAHQRFMDGVMYLDYIYEKR